MKPYGRRGSGQWIDGGQLHNFQWQPCGREWFRNTDQQMEMLPGHLEQGPGVVRLLVETGVILHNLLRIRFPAIANAEVDREDEDHNTIPGAWRGDQQVEGIPQPQALNRDNRVGKVMRDYLKAYFNSEAGSVPWQERLAGINVNWMMTVDILMFKCFTIYVISAYKCSFLPIKCSVYYKKNCTLSWMIVLTCFVHASACIRGIRDRFVADSWSSHEFTR